MNMQSQYNYVLQNFTQSKYMTDSSACTSPSSASFSSWSSSLSEDKGDKPSRPQYRCKTCSKLFTRPSALKTHTYTHTGEKPYECDRAGCGRRFSVISNLRRHVKIHLKSSAPARLTAEERIDCVRRLMKKCKDLDCHSLFTPLTDQNSLALPKLPIKEWPTPDQTPWSILTHNPESFHHSPDYYRLS